MSLDNDGLLKELDALSVTFVGKSDDAANAMADVVRNALVVAAPYDGRNRKFAHLKKIIKKTKAKKKDGSTETIVWVKPRGVKLPAGSKAEKKNYEDKNIYKIVVSEYGTSKMPAHPFWVPTVERNAEKALQAAVREFKK